MTDELIFANGVNGLTGEYLLEALAPTQVAAHAKGRAEDPDLRAAVAANPPRDSTLGLPFDIHPETIAEAGWGIVFSAEEAGEVRDALSPLVEHRRAAVGNVRTKVLEHNPAESWSDWLARYGSRPGNVDPERVPYYLLLVGNPSQIPFTFQYLLDIEYAVGRLDLDQPDNYRSYAKAVISAEEGIAKPRDSSIAFFATRHPGDVATGLSADALVEPLTQAFGAEGRYAALQNHQVLSDIGETATKQTLGEIFAGAGSRGRPRFVFSATHGMGGWPLDDPGQLTDQGALLCQDWPGVGNISPDHYFAARDLPKDAETGGMVAFFFACYGAGTPERDEFERVAGQTPPLIARRAFVAPLPKALLASGTLAVVGHIERAWGYSFIGAGASQLGPFENAIGRTLIGEPVGHAMKDFNERYAVLSTRLLTILDEIDRGGKIVPDSELAALWTERSDAQNYVLLGDPAVTAA